MPVWSYLVAFFTAMAAAVVYFTDSSGYSNVVGLLTGLEHKYAKLLFLSAATLTVGCGAFVVGMLTKPARARAVNVP